MNKEEMIGTLRHTFDELHRTVNLFDQGLLNKIPFDTSWTAGQVIAHTILSASGFVQVMNGETSTTARPIDQHIETIKATFLDFDNKMKSPDFILPPMQNYDREQQLTQLDKIKVEMQKAISSLDLSQTCLAFELPVFGFLTRLEAIYFVIFHTQRHTHQLKEIHRFLNLS